MYWTLESRPPTVDEIMQQGAERIRAAVESVCDKYDAPQVENKYNINMAQAVDGRAQQQRILAQMAARQDMNVRFGITESGQQVGFGGANAFTGYASRPFTPHLEYLAVFYK